MRVCWLLILTLASCGRWDFAERTDAGLTDGARCHPGAPWGTPTRVTSLSSPRQDASARLTADELTAFLSSRNAVDDIDTYIATRSDRTAPFGAAMPVAFDTTNNEYIPSPSDDGDTVVYENPGTAGQADLFISFRTGSTYPPGTMLSLSTPNPDQEPFLRGDGQVLYYVIGTTGYHIYRSVRQGPDFVSSVPVSELDPGGEEDHQMVVTRDDMTIYFATTRGPDGSMDIYTARRPAAGQPFSSPVPVTELNTPADEYPCWISVDDCVMYLTSNRPNRGDVPSYDIWMATRG